MSCLFAILLSPNLFKISPCNSLSLRKLSRFHGSCRPNPVISLPLIRMLQSDSPSRTPPEFPSRPPMKPHRPTELPRTPNYPDFSPDSPDEEVITDPPPFCPGPHPDPDFPGPPTPSPPVPDAPRPPLPSPPAPDIPRGPPPDVFPPHEPDVIPLGPPEIEPPPPNFA